MSVYIAVANRKIKGNIDDDVFKEALSCQVLYLPSDFGLSSPNPHSEDDNIQKNDFVPSEGSQENLAEGNTPAPQPDQSGLEALMKPEKFYGSATGIPKPITTPSKVKASSENQVQSVETPSKVKGATQNMKSSETQDPSYTTPTKSSSATTSTPRTSPRFTKTNVEALNVSDIHGGGGDNLSAVQTQGEKSQANVEGEITSADDNNNNDNDKQSGEPMETDESQAGALNKPFAPPRKVAKKVNPKPAKKGKGRGKNR